MKPSEYIAAHAADGKKIDAETIVGAHTLVNEIIEIKDIARVEKTKFDNPCFVVKIADDTAFFTTSSITRQIDKMLAEGVTPEDLKGSRWLVVKNHLDADPAKGRQACDFLKLEFVDDE